MSTLALLLDGKALDVDATVNYSSEFRELASDGTDGPWVYRVPDQLTARLAETPESDLPQYAKAWAATEEFRLDGWETADALELLTDLHGLAKTAVTKRLSVLMWMSL